MLGPLRSDPPMNRPGSSSSAPSIARVEALVAEVVLRNRMGVTGDATKRRLPLHAEQLCEIVLHDPAQSLVREGRELRLTGASDVSREQHRPFWRAPGEQRAREEGPQDVQAFPSGNQHTKSVERMLDRRSREAECHAGHRRIFDLAEHRKTFPRGRGERKLGRLMTRDGQDNRVSSKHFRP